MCHKTNMSIANYFKKMVKIQSPRIQCCLCAFSVFAALLGMFMMSAGICLILNYNFMEVDTSGLPPHLHNDEGKKVVGIILLCVGLGSLGLSALVSILYFTACLEPSSPGTTVRPEDGRGAPGSRGSDRGLQNGGHPGRASRSSDGHDGYYHHANGGHHHGNGATPGRASPSSSRVAGSSGSLRRAAMASGAKRAGSLPALEHGGPAYSQRMRQNTSTPPSARAHNAQIARHNKKLRHVHHGRFQNPLTSHPEEEEQSVNESRRSMSGKRQRTSSHSSERGGRINYGADLNDDSVLSRDHTGTSDESNVIIIGGAAGAAPPVIITVDSSHIRQVSPYQPHDPQDSSNDGSYKDGWYKEGSYSDSLENGLSKDATQSSDHSNDNADGVGVRTDHTDGAHVFRVSPYEGRLKDLDDFDGDDSRDFDDRHKDFDEGNNDFEDGSRDFDKGAKDFSKGTRGFGGSKRDFEDGVTGFDSGETGFDSGATGFGDRAKGAVSGKNEEDESGRGSRSTDSLGESEVGAEGFEEAKKRLDDRIMQLIQ